MDLPPKHIGVHAEHLEIITPTASTEDDGTGQLETNEDDVLEEIGYKQSYRRALESMGNMCMAIGIASPLVSILVVGQYQVHYGGYWGLTWGWLIPALLILPQALAVAELCSAMPVNGSFYWWSAALVPREWSRYAAFMSGWTLILSMGTSVSSFAYAVAAPLSTVVSSLTSWTPTNPQIFAISILIVIIWVGLSCLRLEDISILVIVNAIIIFCGFLAFLIGLPIARSVRGLGFADAKTVFGTFENSSSWSPGLSACLTFLSSAWVVTGWVVPAYLVEGTKNPQISAPKAIINAYLWMAGLGLPVCLVCAFSITNIEEAAADPSGYPLIKLLLESWTELGGGIFFSIGLINGLIGGSSNLFSSACNIAAFARDGGIPYSEFFSRVHPKQSVPVNAIVLLAVFAGFLLLPGLSNSAGSVIYSMSVIAGIVNYAMPMFLALCFPERYVRGPWNYGRWSRPIMTWAAASQIFLIIIESIPEEDSTTFATFNFGWAVTLFMLIVAAISWFPFRSKFRGVPIQNIERWLAAPRTKDGALIALSPTRVEIDNHS